MQGKPVKRASAEQIDWNEDKRGGDESPEQTLGEQFACFRNKRKTVCREALVFDSRQRPGYCADKHQVARLVAENALPGEANRKVQFGEKRVEAFAAQDVSANKHGHTPPRAKPALIEENPFDAMHSGQNSLTLCRQSCT